MALLSLSIGALALLTPTPPCEQRLSKPAIQSGDAAFSPRRAALAATAPLLTVAAPNYAGADEDGGIIDTILGGAGNLVLFGIVGGLLFFLASYALEFAKELGQQSVNINDALSKEREGAPAPQKPTGPVYDDSNERDMAMFKARPMTEKAKEAAKKKKQLIEAKGAGVEYAPWMRSAFENIDVVAKREKERLAKKRARDKAGR